jgi:DNA-binding CsgD family transcriptional regulator
VAEATAGVADELERAREILQLTRRVLDGHEMLPSIGDDDLQAADEALSAAHRALVEHLARSLLSPREGCRHGEVAALLLRSELMMERLQAMRRAADEHLRAASALADDFTIEVMERAGPTPAPVEGLLKEQDRPRRTTTAHAGGQLADLTAREADVLRALAAGKTNAQIAISLFVAEGTVKSHVKHILRKLGAANRIDAAARYHRPRS